MAGHRLAEVLHMLSKGELSVLSDTQENREGMMNIRFPSMVMLGCQAASAQSRLRKAITPLAVLRVNLALSDHATILSTSCCKDATIMSLLPALQTISTSSALAITKVYFSNLARRSSM